MKRQVRTAAVQAVDAVIPLLGGNGLQTYVSLVKRTTTGALRNSLLALPSHARSSLAVQTGPISFTYASGPDDDLNIACRDDFRTWEPRSRRFFALMSRHSSCILDIGAYSGIYALTGALSNPQAQVWAFEPNPQMCQIAQRNVDINGLQSRVQLMQLALTDEESTRQLFTRGLTGASSMASLIDGSPEDAVAVQTRTLDSLPCAQTADLVKIDVEGGESLVLRGATQCLASRHPVIVMEALTDENLAIQQAILREFGYLEPLPVSRVSDGRGDDRNYVWVTPDRVNTVTRLLDTSYL